MKRYKVLTIICLISVIASCTEMLTSTMADTSVSLHSFSASLQSTKVSFNEDGKSEWDLSDKITVACNGRTGVFESSSKGPVVEFNGELAASEGYGFLAVYPSTAFVNGTGDNVVVTLPSVQTVSPGSYSNIIKIAKSPDTNLFFSNACACLKFKLSQPGITRITVRSNESNYLAGKMTYEWSDGVPCPKLVEEGSEIISIVPEGGEFQEGCYYYAAVLPTVSGEYTVTLEKGNSLGSVVKGPYAFKRNKNLVIDDLDSGASWGGLVRCYDFTTSPNWDLCKDASGSNATYNVREAEGLSHAFIYNNCYSSSTNSGKTKYLVISNGYLGLPVLEGYRLSAVEMTLGNHNTKRYISVNSNEYAAAIVTDGGVQTTVSPEEESVSFDLPNSMEGQRYWLYSKSTFVLGQLKLWYEPASVELEDVDKVISRAIADGTVPGAVLGIWKDGAVVYRKAYGHKSITPTVETMTTDVIFDMASCTKVMSTTMAVMQLYEQGKIDFNKRVSEYLSEFSEDDPVRVIDLLTHVSGLVRPTTDYKLYAANPQGYLEATGSCKRTYAPGERYNYNCINFFVLQQIVERLTGERLCDYVSEHVFKPLGLNDTRYLPTNETTDPEYLARIAPTSSKPSDTGKVNDTMARVVNEGNAGNAGVFSCLDDVLRFGQAILGGGILDGKRVLNESTVSVMSQVVDPEIGRTPGWDCQSVTGYEKGSTISPDAIFHTGYCGTLIVIDVKNNLCIALLANRNHPQNTGYDAWNRYRGYVCDIIGATLL